jgi:hypothetical protein
LAIQRQGFARFYPDAGSNIDTNILFYSAADVVAYGPRAAQIALLSPFPDSWAKPGSTDANTWMRRVSAVEMTGAYLALIFLPSALWRWRRQAAVWLTVVFSFAMSMFYTLAMTNVGSLYRMRYGFFMTLVALGAAELFVRMKAFRRQHAAGGV